MAQQNYPIKSEPNFVLLDLNEGIYILNILFLTPVKNSLQKCQRQDHSWTCHHEIRTICG